MRAHPPLLLSPDRRAGADLVVALFSQIFLNGLLLGGLYALVAAGFSLVWGVMNIVNVSHGAFMMLGGYVTYWLFVKTGLDPFLSIPVSMAVMFACGFVVQRYVLNWIARAPSFSSVTITYGMLILIVNLALIFWGADYRAAQPSYSGASVEVAGILLPPVRLAMFGIALTMTLLLALFMSSTDVGRAITATRMDLAAAQLCGVNVSRIFAVTFAIGGALAAVAGSLYAASYAFSPYLAYAVLGKMFVVVVLAGLGNIRGLLLGGVILGLAETFGALIFGPGLQNAVSYLVLIAVLIVRPTGLGGQAFLR